MNVLIKNFIIEKGGQGLSNIKAFLDSNIKRNAGLIRRLSAVSLNNGKTILTIEYLSSPADPIEITSPTNGLVSSTLSAPNEFIAQYSSSIISGDFTNNKVLFNGTGVTGETRINIVPSSNSQIMSVNLSGLYPNDVFGGFHNLQFDKTISLTNRLDQNNNSIFSYFLVREAAPYIGITDLYSKDYEYGEIDIKYGFLDSSVSPDLRLKDILKNLSIGGRIISYVTVAKSLGQTEVFVLVINRPEPIPIATTPPVGALNKTDVLLDKFTVSFRDPINTGHFAANNLLSLNNGLTGIDTAENNWSYITPVDTYVTFVNDKSIEVDIGQFYLDQGLTTSYLNLIVHPGVRSSSKYGGIASTRPYLLPWSLIANEVLLSGQDTGAGVSVDYVNTVSGDLSGYVDLTSGHIVDHLGTGATIAYIDVVSGDLSGYVDLTSGHIVDHLGTGTSIAYIDTVSGDISGYVDLTSGHIVDHLGTGVTISYVDVVSGDLSGYVNLTSGHIVDHLGTGTSIGYVDNVSGDLVSHVLAVSGDIQGATPARLQSRLNMNTPGVDEQYIMFYTNVPVTITSVHTFFHTGMSTDMQLNFRILHHTNTQDEGNALNIAAYTVTGDPTGHHVTSNFDDPNVQGPSAVWLSTTEVAPTGKVTVIVEYTED